MGKLHFEPPQGKPFTNPPSWRQRYADELEHYAAARDQNNQATHGMEGIDRRVEAGHAEWEAMQDVDALGFETAQDFLFMLRKAVELHPEDLQRLLLEVLADPIADAIVEGSR